MMEGLSSTLGIGDKRDPDITLDMLDYKFIDECNDIKTLEKILRALRSGKDGYYPHLIKHCEVKVTKLNPKSRSLRTENKVLKPRDLASDEAENLQNGMGEWLSEMKNNETSTNGFKEKELPPVRSNTQQVKKNTPNAKKTQKIKGSDFRAWDKYDAEEECKKVDDPDHVPTKKKNIEISSSIDSSQMTDAEKQMCADKEKEKGNEAFRAGDFDEALVYYSRSISLLHTAASVNNRALTYLRLERYKDALKDCDQVLLLENDNIKAKLRRATALKELSRLEEAKEDLEFVLQVESNNARAKKILDDVNLKLSRKGRKMKIMEVDDDQEESPPAVSGEATPTLVNGGAHKNEVSANTTSGKSSPDNNQLTTENMKTKEHEKLENEQNSTSNLSKDGAGKDKNQKALASEKTKNSSKEAKSAVTAEISTKPSTSTAVLEAPVNVAPIQTPLPPDIEKIKKAAGELFRTGQYGSASEKYTTAISLLETKADGDTNKNFSHALAVLYNNRAACKLKSGNDKACITDCDHVLQLKPGDVKALIRRGSAYEHMEKYSMAYNDFRAAQNIDWTISQAQDGANRVAKQLRETYGSNWKEKVEQKSQDSFQPLKITSKTDPAPKPSNITEKTTTQSTNSIQRESKSQEKTSSKPVLKSDTKASSDNKNVTKTKTEKRAEITEKLFNKLKTDGNNLVKKGNYVAAIESYTQCIKICPNEVAGYTNRAFCFLRLKKEVCVVNDCSEAIKLDSKSVKAYYRRALANKGLKLYREAEKDLRKVLELEPFNKSAVNELKEVQKLGQASNRRKMPIKEVSDDGSSSENETSEAKKENELPSKNTNINVDSKSAESSSATKNVGQSKLKEKVEFVESNITDKVEKQVLSNDCPTTSKIKQDRVSDKSSTSNNQHTTSKTEKGRVSEKPPNTKNQPKKSSLESNPITVRLQVPDTLTPYEFGKLWNSVQPKTNLALYKTILDKVPANQIPAIVSNKTKDDMIVAFAEIARKHLSTGFVAKANRAYDILHFISKAQRFDMAVMFLSKPDKATVQAAFTELGDFAKSNPVTFTQTNLDNLVKVYGL